MSLSEYPVIYEQKVAWGDMDAFGHVNNVIYHRYIESARLAYLDLLNIFDEDIFTVVASNECRYYKPVLYPDIINIGARVEEVRNSAFRMSYKLWSTQLNSEVAYGEAVLVCVNKDDMTKMLIPEGIKAKIKGLESKVNHFF
jgi:acyl-CoA thioester hydrolase